MAMFIHKVNENEEEWLIHQELHAAMEAIQQDYYVVWRSQVTKEDCMRIGSASLCFCGHEYGAHKAKYPHGCKGCLCKDFSYVPSRPEEVGDWWLTRRPEYVPGTWRAKCRCGHPHTEHHVDRVKSRRCRVSGCRCSLWRSDFLCLVCDKHGEDHETVFEDGAERRAQGKSTGPDYLPLADAPELQHLVLVDGSPEALEQAKGILTAYAMGQGRGALGQGGGRLNALGGGVRGRGAPMLRGGRGAGGRGRGRGRGKGKSTRGRAAVPLPSRP